MNIYKSAYYKNEITEILNPETKNDQPCDLRDRVESFVRDCAATADGEMDISYQENGKGYYAHLHELDRLKDVSLEDYLEYKEKLLSELNEANKNNEITHQMKAVYDQISKDEG